MIKVIENHLLDGSEVKREVPRKHSEKRNRLKMKRVCLSGSASAGNPEVRAQVETGLGSVGDTARRRRNTLSAGHQQVGYISLS